MSKEKLNVISDLEEVENATVERKQEPSDFEEDSKGKFTSKTRIHLFFSLSPVTVTFEIRHELAGRYTTGHENVYNSVSGHCDVINFKQPVLDKVPFPPAADRVFPM